MASSVALTQIKIQIDSRHPIFDIATQRKEELMYEMGVFFAWKCSDCAQNCLLTILASVSSCVSTTMIQRGESES